MVMSSTSIVNVPATRSGYEPRPSLYKYNQNFKLKTFPISNKSCALPFLETAVVCRYFVKLSKASFDC